MKSAYQIIRRPVITEKGLSVKENEGTLVFEVASKATKTEVKEAVQKIFKVKVDSSSNETIQVVMDWKKAYVRLKTGEKMPEYAQNL